MSVATAILVPALALVLFFALIATARLVRGWREPAGEAARAEDPAIVALEDEKQRIFATLRDLDHEHQLGKLSDADHAGLKRHFEREALRVLERLDALRAEAAARGAAHDAAGTGRAGGAA